MDTLYKEACELALQTADKEEMTMLKKGTDVKAHAPFCLFPMEVPKAIMNQAYQVSVDFNALVHKISYDNEFLQQLSLLHGVDEFTTHLFEIFSKVHNQAKVPRMAIHRSDYMLHQGSILQQVELNTISSAFAMLSTAVNHVHRSIASHLNLEQKNILCSESQEQVPHLFANTIALYRKTNGIPADQPVSVLLVVQPGEGNRSDQEILQRQLQHLHNITPIRASLTELSDPGIASVSTAGVLTVRGHEIGLVYFRAGYTPDDYPSAAEWRVREAIESSRAVKCPCIQYHLIGTKKMQQLLAAPGVVEKYVDAAAAARIRTCFTSLYSLDDRTDDVDAVKAMVVANPDAYVMKPQREGGGNCLFGKDIVAAMGGMPKEELRAYIIMDRIQPTVKTNHIVRNGVVGPAVDVVSELGTYGLFLGDESSTYMNECAGYLVRSKDVRNNDGGVAAGVAVLDSVYLRS